ncbi:MAG TPA: M20/M25/M40 family metallo-hydrolase [Desulfobulbaceae bacterium]|nr:M20/M25/M40 family metallo-hydrolase [Desulfobulbaceae bacterium]
MINKERLAATFTVLCETDSPSRHEGAVAVRLKEIWATLSPDKSFEDDSALRTGSESGNLFFQFNGTLDREPLFFNCHMDTVEPGVGVRVKREGDLFTSAGDTVLGSDDKSGIAALIEAMHIIREHNLSHRPVEFIFTTCEEIGLLGAKALDPGNIRATFGYALDSSGSGRVIIGAPASNRLKIRINGVAAHAGLHPERGVNALILASRALAQVPDGRVDDDTTVNFGTICGGVASNIVPERVTIEGEVRSHSQKKLAELTERIEKIFEDTIDKWRDPCGKAKGRPSVDFNAHLDFPLMRLAPESRVVREVDLAAKSIDMDLAPVVAGGGSDANIFNGYGLDTAIIATGMTNVHSVNEQVNLEDMVDLTRLILALLTR